MAVCKLLMECLHEKNPKTIRNETPLHFAARNGHLSICKLIINNISDKNPIDSYGQTPLQLAILYGHQFVGKLIKERISDEPLGVFGRSGNPISTTGPPGLSDLSLTPNER